MLFISIGGANGMVIFIRTVTNPYCARRIRISWSWFDISILIQCAGLVRSLEELNQFKWTGHGALMGQIHRPWQACEEVRALFSIQQREAVDGYSRFIMDGFSMGRRPELTGGGLKRIAGGWEGVKKLRDYREPRRGDERILGNGDFDERVFHAVEENLTQAQELAKQGWDLTRLAEAICH